ncbi:diguanylate cyclase [Pontibacterium sp. N1Y112]|uniref:diguanylate cyclase n=1 Tax=Pontibacterium sinense TaxID=2781979 RepID=A0A8J7K5M7_9GAMM|nr:sensor domain-containing diguanylate cyclase [Pontibacterium sinense]MBE9397205.1 diguanylate cyclase [Pontibacterium sinense]
MNFEQVRDELKQASSSIALLEQELSILFTALPDPIFIIDVNGCYLEVLAGNSRELYLDSNYLRGKCIKDLFSPELGESFMSAIHQALESKKLTLIEYEISSDDFLQSHTTSSNWFQGRIVPLKTNNKADRLVAWVAVNITDRKQLEHQLKELSQRDALTGLLNRRYLQEDVTKRIAAYKRYKNSFSLAFLDIDYFKNINDTFGHDTGDYVLKELSLVVDKEKRESDVFARFGGEEFILVFPDTSQNAAAVFLERLRALIERLSFETPTGEVTFTVSMGLTEIMELDGDFDSIVKRADKALYEAKNQGRNRLVIA